MQTIKIERFFISVELAKIPEKINYKPANHTPDTNVLFGFDIFAEEEFRARARAVPGATSNLPMNNSDTARLTAEYGLRQTK